MGKSAMCYFLGALLIRWYQFFPGTQMCRRFCDSVWRKLLSYSPQSCQHDKEICLAGRLGLYAYGSEGGVFYCLSLFLLGYSIAKSGIIEHIKEYATLKWLLVFSALYILLILTDWRFQVPVFKCLGYLCGAPLLCYTVSNSL